MGTIVIHAGMGKTGSTSLQDWLQQQAPALLKKSNTAVVRAELQNGWFRSDPSVCFVPPTSLGVASNSLADVLRTNRDQNPEWCKQFANGLKALSERHDLTVVSSEAFAQLFQAGHPHFLSALDNVAASTPVRVAYYVRPQHTALEAWWRQWGFRMEMTAPDYIRKFSTYMHYLQTASLVREVAPRIAFEVRPFIPDNSKFSNVCADFATEFLRLNHTDCEQIVPVWANRGISLEATILLRQAAECMLWRDRDDNDLLDWLQPLLARVTIDPDENIVASRKLLWSYAHRVFEAENQALIAQFGWEIDTMIPTPTDDVECDANSLDLLEEYWSPTMSKNEERLFFAVLNELDDMRKRVLHR
jgi:hypothetical protein